MRKLKTSPTLVGFIALLIWASGATVISELKNIPSFQLLTIGFSISFLFSITSIAIRKRWHIVNQPPKVWLLGTLGLGGNTIAFALAFKFAPAAQADLIVYLWPILVILISKFFISSEIVKTKHLLAAIIAFIGVAIVLFSGTAFSITHTIGYLFAFICAISWTTYVLFTRLKKDTPPELIGCFFGLCIPLTLFLHFKYETLSIPSLSQIPYLFFYAVISVSLSFYLWNFAIKRGNFKLLNVLSYTNPIISVTLLILFGHAQLTGTLAIASLLVASSVAVARS